jgi:hypothetical protein
MNPDVTGVGFGVIRQEPVTRLPHIGDCFPIRPYARVYQTFYVIVIILLSIVNVAANKRSSIYHPPVEHHCPQPSVAPILNAPPATLFIDDLTLYALYDDAECQL